MLVLSRTNNEQEAQMSKHTESCQAKIQTCYPQTLKQAIDRYLPYSLFDQGGVKLLRWCERYLAICALMMAWSMADVLADRFDEARRAVVKMFPGRKRPGKTYTGFVDALKKKSDALLARIAEHLRGELRRVAGERHWEHLGFVPIGADGSKVECPKTLNNEETFGCAGKKKSTPQQFVTTLLHLPTGVVWEYMTGPARSSERHHVRQMLPTLPKNTLLIADAGFTGYDLLTMIQASGHSFLIRVGANVRLLLKLGYALEERDGTVYLWPDELQKKNKQKPPLVLRLITLCDGRNRRMHLLTNVHDESRLSEAAACEFYTMRWGVELYYRALKQTLAHRKLASDAPETARMELRWAMMGLWLLSLMAVEQIGRSGKDVRRLSVATALRRVRKAMRAPSTRSGSAGLGRQLASAVKDNYVRKTSKRARAWAHKKKPKPIGDPKARIADESQVQLARELRELAVAA
jgi:DDE family transposase